MKILFQLWKNFRQWLGLPQTYVPIAVEDVPDVVEPSSLYLVGQTGNPWSAALLCPCGCQSLIQLSLLPDDVPRWRVTYNSNETVTLHPSIWRIKGCRSHFFLRFNQIVWARGMHDAG